MQIDDIEISIRSLDGRYVRIACAGTKGIFICGRYGMMVSIWGGGGVVMSWTIDFLVEC